MRFQTDEEAIKMANDTEYGISRHIFIMKQAIYFFGVFSMN